MVSPLQPPGVVAKGRLAFCLLAWVFVALWFYRPMREAMDPSLDSSNYGSYAYFSAHHFQFGPEVVPMSGPFGFVLYGTTYNGDLFYEHIAGQLIVSAALAAFTLWFFSLNKGSQWRWVWLAAHLLFTPYLEDLPFEWTLLLGGVFLLRAKPGALNGLLVAATCAIIALISLIKGTHLMLAFATLGVVAASLVWRREWARLELIAAGYLGALAALWLFASQSFVNIPSYVRGVMELVSGYNQAMSLFEPAGIFIHGVVVVGLLALAIAAAASLRPRDKLLASTLLLVLGHSFVQWKHGFVRADGHMGIFFHYAITCAAFIVLVSAGRARLLAGWRIAVVHLVALAVIVACLLGNEGFIFPRPLYALKNVPGEFARHYTELFTLPSLRTTLEMELQAHREEYAMPLVKDKVGRETIDLFGYEHGFIPLNGLNYHPRPMGGGSFNVYTPLLMQMNRDFIRSPLNRPSFYLFKAQTIDNRLLTLDDSLAFLEILRNYRPVFMENDLLLMRALPPGGTEEPQLISTRHVVFGDMFPVPQVKPDELLLARVDVRMNLLGSLLNFVYKVPRISISLHGNAIPNQGKRRLIPTMASVPFLLSPVVESTGDFLFLYSDQPGKVAEQIRISTTDRTWFVRDITVEFYRQRRPLPLPSINLTTLMTNAATASENLTSHDAQGRPLALRVQTVHAPGELPLILDGSEREFGFGYGFMPGSWEKPDQTDGAEYVIELRREERAPVRVANFSLFPTTIPADRAYRRVEFALPYDIHSGDQLVITTRPGPHGNAAWDWTYAGQLRFDYGPFRPAQFPGFNVTPSALEADLARISSVEGRPVLVLPAPGQISFQLKGGEHTLAFNFGSIHFDYAGNSPRGATRFTVELARHGRKTEIIYQRLLDPIAKVTAYTAQSAVVSLPPVQPGDQLILRTYHETNGLPPWGWPYVSELNLQ